MKSSQESKFCGIPDQKQINGLYCHLEKFNSNIHSKELYQCLCKHSDQSIWQYLPAGPFDSYQSFTNWLSSLQNNVIYIIFDSNNHQITGLICYLNIEPKHKSIEIGWVTFANKMQRTRIGTEVIYLLLNYVFHLGYRRCEWKCDHLNKKSSNAALRFGFIFEGTFRQHRIIKDRNRDTDWFSIIDGEWPALQTKYQQWLDPNNFDQFGKQNNKLNIKQITAG